MLNGVEYDRAVKKHRTDHPEFDHGFYIDIYNIIRPTGQIPASCFPSTRALHIYDCRCHTCYDWTKDPSISSNTGFSAHRSTASHQAYEAQWDNWTANHSPRGTPDSRVSTIATHATLYSDDPLPDDGAANVVKVNTIQHRKHRCMMSWTHVPIISSVTLGPGLRIPTLFR